MPSSNRTSDVATNELPPWAEVGERRRAHIARVTALLDEWAQAMRLPPDEARAWHDAGCWHDALRDAEPGGLVELADDPELPLKALHGPAAAARLRADGETRESVLQAIAWHTVGSPDWDRTGRALYMADYLEPGRTFAREERAALASAVPRGFDSTFREVVRHRLIWALREGYPLHHQTVSLWNAVR
jgi:2-amino-4-hydroxy-6-hydroxymethyldihydropteridine diphosphokinase